MLENIFSTYGARAALERVKSAIQELSQVRQTLAQGVDGLERIRRSHNAPRPLYSNPTLNAAIWLADSAPRVFDSLRQKECELVQIINDGRALISGVEFAMGVKYASVLRMYYMRAMTHEEIRNVTGISLPMIERYKAVALDYMNAVGYNRALQGVSISDI